MTKRRAKIAAGATVLGLGALGGVALSSNPGMPPAATQQLASTGSDQIVTSASGAAATPATQTVAVRSGTSTHAPIVTRASSSGVPRGIELDD